MPLHPRSGRRVNRQNVVQEVAQEVTLEQTPDISLPQSSGSSVQQPVHVEENVQNVQDFQNLVQEVANPVVASRRSGRVIRKPVRFTLLGESYDRIPEEPNTEPLNYAEALHDKDADMWVVAMKSEMESMYSNKVWDLVEPPEGVKPIGCKWIFKKKRGVDGKVKTFKARLVAKGFTQKEEIDYEDTFLPVAMLKSIRILLSIAAHYNYEIWQMDVKTAFLNGSLDECIYMAQPEGFKESGNEHKFCKLKRSIYGLKQASRA